MKKILAALLALFVLCASAALADRIDDPDMPDEPLLRSFRETIDIVCDADVDWNENALVAAVERGGQYCRFVTLLDDHAKGLYNASLEGGDINEFIDYAFALPVNYIELITAKPLEEAELNTLVGKTVGEAAALGYSLCGSGGGEGSPVTVSLYKGFFDYEFEVDIPFKDYMDRIDRDLQEDFEDLVITGYNYCEGLSYLALDIRFRADGTLDPGALGMEEHQSY